MPTYPATKTYRGGFYNNKKVNGADDRVYTAEDIRKPYDTIYTDGVLPVSDGTAGDTLKVTGTGGLGIAVGVGNAKLGGAWFENFAAYGIELDVGGSADRYDCVIIRNDDSDDVREPSIYIKSISAIPTIDNLGLSRTGDVYEICVAYVKVAAFSTEILETDIVDTREDGELCNVMSGVGAVVVRTYRNTYFSETANQRVIPIGISQYNKSRDELTVIVEGRVFAEGDNYVIWSNSREISLNISLPVVGTRIDFEVKKNVNAAGAETVVQEVAELRKEMTAANKKLENFYYCNGVNDNINISNIVKEFLALGYYHSLKISVIGHFGFTEMAAGNGESATPYKLFDFDMGNVTPKPKCIIDFSECNEISVPVESGKYTVIFGGKDFEIRGANVYAENTDTDTVVRVFSNDAHIIKAVDCRFWVTGYKDSLIAVTGLFENCYGKVANVTNNSYCFLPAGTGLLRVNGGEYCAYVGNSANFSAVVGQSDANAVSILKGINAPTVARTGYYQTHSLIQFTDGGIMNSTDLVSALTVTVITGISNIRDTIAKSKPNLM